MIKIYFAVVEKKNYSPLIQLKKLISAELCKFSPATWNSLHLPSIFSHLPISAAIVFVSHAWRIRGKQIEGTNCATQIAFFCIDRNGYFLYIVVIDCSTFIQNIGQSSPLPFPFY